MSLSDRPKQSDDVLLDPGRSFGSPNFMPDHDFLRINGLRFTLHFLTGIVVSKCNPLVGLGPADGFKRQRLDPGRSRGPAVSLLLVLGFLGGSAAPYLPIQSCARW